MRSGMRRTPVLLAAIATMTSIAACKGSGAVRAHQTLASLETLRTAFNADSGKVRAIFLASPT